MSSKALRVSLPRPGMPWGQKSQPSAKARKMHLRLSRLRLDLNFSMVWVSAELPVTAKFLKSIQIFYDFKGYCKTSLKIDVKRGLFFFNTGIS